MFKRCKILVLIFILFPFIGYSQNIHIDIMEFASNYWGGNEQNYTYKIWLEDIGGDCREQNGNNQTWYRLSPYWWSKDFTPIEPFNFKIKLEAWEDDVGTRCAYTEKKFLQAGDEGYMSPSEKYVWIGDDKPSSIYEENWTNRELAWWDGNYNLRIKTKWSPPILEMKKPIINGKEINNACGANDLITLTCNKTLAGGSYLWEVNDNYGDEWKFIGLTSEPNVSFISPSFNTGVRVCSYRVIPVIKGVKCYHLQSYFDRNVTVINTYPSKPIVTISSLSPKCFLGGDAEIKLDIDGKLNKGVEKYKFSLQYYSGPYIPLDDPYIESNQYTITSANLAADRTLNAGRYSLIIGNIVNDGLYCSDTFDITISPRPPLTIQTESPKAHGSSFNISCNGKDDGQIKIVGTGGTPPYKYILKEGDDSVSTPLIYKNNEDYTFINLKPNLSYQLFVIDTNNCGASSSKIILTEPSPLKSTINLNDYSGNFNIPCFGAKDTSYVSVLGGIPPYNVSIGDEIKVIDQSGEIAIFNGLMGNTLYSVEILDKNNCKLTLDTTLTQPSQIDITSLDLTTCNGEGNGTASISALGGLASSGYYTYTLLRDSSEIKKVSSESVKYTDLGSGLYRVRVTDRNNCIKDTTFLVPESALPPAVKDTVICKGQVLELNAEDTGYTSYLWKSEFKTISNTSKASMNAIGTYWLSVKNKYGCGSEKSFRLRISDELLQANFAMPSEAFAGDSIVISEISWPVPTKLDWSMPDSFYVYEKEGDLQFIKMPTQPGIYPVKLTAYLGQCWDDIEKKITIYDFSQDSLGGAAGGFSGIKTIGVYPNPNSGDFTVQVFLTDPMQVTIEVRDMFRPVPIMSIQDNHKNYYSIPFDLNLVQGTYVLTVRTAQDSQSFKFVVQN